MSHIAASDSEDPGDEQYGRKSRGRKGYASAAFPFSHSQTIDENLSEASGGPSVSKDRDKDRLSYKKQTRRFENYDNNNPATTYGTTAATIISDQRSEQQPLIFSRPRPPMQQHNQNRLPGDRDQDGGDGAVNAQGPPDDAGIGGHQPPGGGDWKEKCCKIYRPVRFASVFVVTLVFLVGVVSIIVWLTVINKQNTKPQVTYANLFEVIPLEHKFHPLTKGGADVKVNLTGRVDPKFEEAHFQLSLYRGSCVSPPNQTPTTSGRAENYPIVGNNAYISQHVIMLGPIAELNMSFTLSNSTLMNDTNIDIRVYFFKSYEDLMDCKTSEDGRKCPCFFSLPSDNIPSFNYANGSYGYDVICEAKPFEGQHYFLTKFVNQDESRSITYNNLSVSFSFMYNTTGVFNPLATDFTGQECKLLDDTNDKIYEYSCGMDYGSFFTAGRSLCTYLTLATPNYLAAEIDSRFRDLFPVTITERNRDDVMLFVAVVVLLAILLVLISYCAPCRLILKIVRSGYAHRAYQALN